MGAFNPLNTPAVHLARCLARPRGELAECCPGRSHDPHLRRLLYSIQLLFTLPLSQVQLLLQGLDFSLFLIHLPFEIFHLEKGKSHTTKRILKWLSCIITLL